LRAAAAAGDAGEPFAYAGRLHAKLSGVYRFHVPRTLPRALVVHLAVLALVAWAATSLLETTARSWFERDIAMRARLAVSVARGALVSHIGRGDRSRLAAVLDEIARNEHVVAAAACGTAGGTLARTRGLPAPLACDALSRAAPSAGAPRLSSREIDFSTLVDGGQVLVSVLPLLQGNALLGNIVLVHDMSYAVQRQEEVRTFGIAAFAIVALLAGALTFALRSTSWRSWTHELRRLLILGRGACPDRIWRGPFQPLLADVQRMAAELALPQDLAAGPPSARSDLVRGRWVDGPWSAERLQRVLQRTLRGEGVVVVSNREPYLHEHDGAGGVRVHSPASGLVTALEPVMRACSGTWIAHGSGSADRGAVDDADRVMVPPGREAYALRRVWLSPDEETGYYYGFSNEGLWPLCHMAHARPAFRSDDWARYQLVNERFAEAVCQEAKVADPIVLVQDYHLALVPRFVRRRLPRATVITFWHIPWPNAERFGTCPWSAELLSGLLGSSIVGFHTQLHCNNFIESVERLAEARIDRELQAVVRGGRPSLVRSYPISIEWPNGLAQSAEPAAACRRSVRAELGLAPDALVGVGVDRLDYTKGIEERLMAVERLLERAPHLRGRFTFVQLAAPSRTVIERYRALAESVEALAARVNQRFGAGGYRPVVLLRAHHEPPAVFRYLRAADVCYVSSLHDGMNLVAKEFVAARDDERGVLVLSRFTGAARELTEALIVNPYDLNQASAALLAALEMSPREQAERMRALRGVVSEFNVYRWAGQILTDAARARQHGRLSERLSPRPRGVEEVPA
jgi:trehalose 6-phosphate synthase